MEVLERRRDEVNELYVADGGGCSDVDQHLLISWKERHGLRGGLAWTAFECLLDAGEASQARVLVEKAAEGIATRGRRVRHGLEQRLAEHSDIGDVKHASREGDASASEAPDGADPTAAELQREQHRVGIVKIDRARMKKIDRLKIQACIEFEQHEAGGAHGREEVCHELACERAFLRLGPSEDPEIETGHGISVLREGDIERAGVEPVVDATRSKCGGIRYRAPGLEHRQLVAAGRRVKVPGRRERQMQSARCRREADSGPGDERRATE
ncbi:MAG TPA: hypothetical protein VJN67_23290 [Stellaceae bacterium]|nr:hypothetical protein [Stellaceae bacterium]